MKPVNPSRKTTDIDPDEDCAWRSLWFLGDVHGDLRHIGQALAAHRQTGQPMPSWLIFLGDMELTAPMREVIAPLRRVMPDLGVAFIHGNHDADTHEAWQWLQDSGEAVSLHGGVHLLNGIRVAGMGGNFLGRVWTPPQEPVIPKREAGTTRPRGKLASPKFHGAIYADEVDRLSRERADILITHEAYSYHPYGWEALDDLGRKLRVQRGFHGHTHDDLVDLAAEHRSRMGFQAIPVGFRCIKNGLGEWIWRHNQQDPLGWILLDNEPPSGRFPCNAPR